MAYTRRWMAVSLAVLLLAGAAQAQTARKSRSNTGPPDYLNAEKLMDQAVRNIAARYNLNEEQTKKTSDILKRDVRKFLQDNYDEVWPLIRALTATQMVGEPPANPKEQKRIASAIKPLAEKAMKAIYEGNEEWRQYLSEDQKRMHDFDMKEMRRFEKQLGQTIDTWSNGAATGPSIFPPPEHYPNEPTRPVRPPAGLPNAQPKIKEAVRTNLNPDMFEARFQKFVREYDLTEGQLTAARSILVEYKQRANAYREGTAAERAKALNDRRDALARGEREAAAAADKKHNELLEPLNVLFQEMETRFEALLESSQKQKPGGNAKPAAEKKPGDRASQKVKTQVPKKKGD